MDLGGVVDFEPEDTRGVLVVGVVAGDQVGIREEEEGGKRGSEKRTVHGGMAGGFRGVDILAFGAIESHLALVEEVVLPVGKNKHAFAECSGASAEIPLPILFSLEN